MKNLPLTGIAFLIIALVQLFLTFRIDGMQKRIIDLEYKIVILSQLCGSLKSLSK